MRQVGANVDNRDSINIPRSFCPAHPSLSLFSTSKVLSPHVKEAQSPEISDTETEVYNDDDDNCRYFMASL